MNLQCGGCWRKRSFLERLASTCCCFLNVGFSETFGIATKLFFFLLFLMRLVDAWRAMDQMTECRLYASTVLRIGGLILTICLR